ncbi:MAG TPA: N-acetylmuramoyl-L-alanine amidase [Kofleriaceae bacterium]
MASRFKISGDVVIGGQRIHTDAPIVTWYESGWDAQSKFCIPTLTNSNPHAQCHATAGGEAPYGGPTYSQRYSLRPALRRYGEKPPLDAIKAVIKQFVVHHDGCADSDMCFNVLHNERGLSCHFLLDWDGTIYQTIDLGLAAWHAAEWNTNSIGIEIANFGDANAKPGRYEAAKGRLGPVRDRVPIRINGHKILAYDFTKAQYDSFALLVRALQKILPNLPVDYPQSSPGVQSWDTLPQAASFGFAGYISHYHLITQKWDPGPFNFKERLGKLRGAFSLPIFWREPKPGEEKPVIPEAREDLKAASDKLHEMNELRADGGFFPVGPWGEYRLWHGGIHLPALPGKEHQDVFAPFPGRVVAARMGTPGPIGSTNFVLARHDLTLGQLKVQFFSLYMHLQDETKAEKQAEWMTQSKAWQEAKPGEVALLDEPLEAGALIGHMGVAGPPDNSKAQLHLEFFSNGNLFADIPNTPWEIIDGTNGGRFCDVQRINDLIDTNPHDGQLSKSELKAFFESGGGGATHYFVTFHVSEWTAEPNWTEALSVPADFKKLTKKDIEQIVADQITPGLWWDQRVAQHAKLALDGIVYHYNPVSFVEWFNQQILEAEAVAPKEKLTDKDTSVATVKDDFDDKEGTSMRSSIDMTDDPCNKSLTLNELVLGYDQPDCAPQ